MDKITESNGKAVKKAAKKTEPEELSAPLSQVEGLQLQLAWQKKLKADADVRASVLELEMVKNQIFQNHPDKEILGLSLEDMSIKYRLKA